MTFIEQTEVYLQRIDDVGHELSDVLATISLTDKTIILEKDIKTNSTVSDITDIIISDDEAKIVLECTESIKVLFQILIKRFKEWQEHVDKEHNEANQRTEKKYEDKKDLVEIIIYQDKFLDEILSEMSPYMEDFILSTKDVEKVNVGITSITTIINILKEKMTPF